MFHVLLLALASTSRPAKAEVIAFRRSTVGFGGLGVEHRAFCLEASFHSELASVVALRDLLLDPGFNFMPDEEAPAISAPAGTHRDRAREPCVLYRSVN